VPVVVVVVVGRPATVGRVRIVGFGESGSGAVVLGPEAARVLVAVVAEAVVAVEVVDDWVE
jgi:hypothetical protein